MFDGSLFFFPSLLVHLFWSFPVMKLAPILVLSALLLPGGSTFQFMSKWKMPTYDPYEEAVKEKFGDKSMVKSFAL